MASRSVVIVVVHRDGKQKINVIIWNQYWKQTRTHSAGPSIFYYQSRHRLLASLILHMHVYVLGHSILLHKN
jgi:hypothetical protein